MRKRSRKPSEQDCRKGQNSQSSAPHRRGVDSAAEGEVRRPGSERRGRRGGGRRGAEGEARPEAVSAEAWSGGGGPPRGSRRGAELRRLEEEAPRQAGRRGAEGEARPEAVGRGPELRQ
uniref:Uncharacterized protein n=1 Tax=Phyllostachys edulis TaxID=38705 RepID=D3IVR2_PHYED|nr:hypothetical protein [Phyllostachys edulis]